MQEQTKDNHIETESQDFKDKLSKSRKIAYKLITKYGKHLRFPDNFRKLIRSNVKAGTKISSNEYTTLSIIASYFTWNHQDPRFLTCYPSADTLSDVLGESNRNIHRLIKRLVDKEIIIYRKGSKNRSNLYSLHAKFLNTWLNDLSKQSVTNEECYVDPDLDDMEYLEDLEDDEPIDEPIDEPKSEQIQATIEDKPDNNISVSPETLSSLNANKDDVQQVYNPYGPIGEQYTDEYVDEFSDEQVLDYRSDYHDPVFDEWDKLLVDEIRLKKEREELQRIEDEKYSNLPF